MHKRPTTTMTPAKSEQEIKIQFARRFGDINISLPKLRKLIKTVCLRFGKNEISESIETSSVKYEISITIVDDKEFKRINYEFLKRKSISDCLSFDLSENQPGFPKTFELVINGQMALRQAKLRKHSSEAEFALYITHGLLHNFGFDDSEPAMAKNMHEKEDEILRELGYGFVYNKIKNTKK